MMNVAKRSITIAAAAAALVATTGGAGVAGQARGPDVSPRTAEQAILLHDGGGDVWTYSDTTTGSTRATRADADVLGGRVVAGTHALRIRMRYDDLRLKATQWYRVTVRTPDATIPFVLEAKKGHWHGIAYQVEAGEWVAAPTVAHHVDYAADVVTVRIPYTALGSPASVQVRLRSDLGVGDSTFFTDNPMTHGPRSAFTDSLTLP
jgi:hypothetical protein